MRDTILFHSSSPPCTSAESFRFLCRTAIAHSTASIPLNIRPVRRWFVALSCGHYIGIWGLSRRCQPYHQRVFSVCVCERGTIQNADRQSTTGKNETKTHRCRCNCIRRSIAMQTWCRGIGLRLPRTVRILWRRCVMRRRTFGGLIGLIGLIRSTPLTLNYHSAKCARPTSLCINVPQTTISRATSNCPCHLCVCVYGEKAVSDYSGSRCAFTLFTLACVN